MEETDRQKIRSYRCDILKRISPEINGFTDRLYSEGIIGESMKVNSTYKVHFQEYFGRFAQYYFSVNQISKLLRLFSVNTFRMQYNDRIIFFSLMFQFVSIAVIGAMLFGVLGD